MIQPSLSLPVPGLVADKSAVPDVSTVSMTLFLYRPSVTRRPTLFCLQVERRRNRCEDTEPYTGTYADVIARGETFVRCLACGEVVVVGVVNCIPKDAGTAHDHYYALSNDLSLDLTNLQS